MRKALVLLALVSICGCRHLDMSSWQKVKVNDYFSYYAFDNSRSVEYSLYVVLPGLNQDYERKASNIIKNYLVKNNKDGIIIVPYVNYDNPEMYFRYVELVIGQLRVDKLYLVGYSCGAVNSLTLGDRYDATALLPMVAGSYKAGGGTPYDDLPCPGVGSIWFVNAYDVSTFRKYGILFDGSVYVDPTKRLFDMMTGDVRMTLDPNHDHGDAYEILGEDVEILDWLSTR